jgi:hypothetical protein
MFDLIEGHAKIISKFSKSRELIPQLSCLSQLQIVDIPATLLNRMNSVLIVGAACFFLEDGTPAGADSLSQKHKQTCHHTHVIGHGLMLLLSIAKWRDLLNSQLLVYNGDRQAPPDLLNLLSEGTDLDPDIWLMGHKSILAFPHRKASASLNRRSFGSKRYF